MSYKFLLSAAILVTGSIAWSAHAELIANPPEVDFDAVQVGGPEQIATVSIENIGAPAEISVLNTCSIPFDVNNFCEGDLGQGESCMIEIEYSPTVQGFQGCEIYVSSPGGDQTISVSGDGI